MQIAVRCRNVEVPEHVRAAAQEKVTRLGRFLEGMDTAEVSFYEEKNPRIAERECCEVVMHGHGHVVRARATAVDTMAAVDRVVDKLGRQVRRFHEKRTDRKGPRPETAVIAANGTVDVEASDLDLDLDEPDRDEATRDRLVGLVRTKRFSLKPMDVDEAIEQMELLGHDFYLFHNAAEASFNVVYRRRDGTYGLLAPHRG